MDRSNIISPKNYDEENEDDDESEGRLKVSFGYLMSVE